MLQPRVAVAKALRAAGGPLAAYPHSGTRLSSAQMQTLGLQLAELPNWAEAGRVKIATPGQPETAVTEVIYLGIFAPGASAVSLIGSFNNWQPGHSYLTKTAVGWWHCTLALSAGVHAYRFWVERPDEPEGTWLPDYENSAVVESGYRAGHSILRV